MSSLFEAMHAEDRERDWRHWQPPELPSLSNVTDIQIDFETTGLKWWDGARAIGMSLCLPDMSTRYFPIRHKVGPNIPEERFWEWMRREVRGKRITNTNIPFEVQIALNDGISLEDQGNTVADVMHYAALLDDHRKRFSQDVLVKDFLGEDEAKVKAVNGEVLDMTRAADYPSGMMAVRAEADVRQVRKLIDVMWPKLTAEDLHASRIIEEECIYAVCEMTRNAAPIDVPLLKEWVAESEQRYLRYLWQVKRGTGVDFNPAQNESWIRLFEKRGIPITERTEPTTAFPEGQASFTDDILKRIDDEYVQIGRKAGKLADLRSDYLIKYDRTIGPDGLLRYALHQLKSDDGGTITGRFSSSGIKIDRETIGANNQQVPEPNKQVAKGHDRDFIIRRLYVPGSGLFCAADAKQIEYRLFAHYAENPEILRLYAEDPDMSFHRYTHGLFLPFKPDLIYEQQKNINFMKIYAGGLTKLAVMLEYITESEGERLKRQYKPKSPPRDHPLLREAAKVDDIYKRVLPEGAALINWCSEIAHDRGYVKTFLGFRQRFKTTLPDGTVKHMGREHKALNGVIQGGAAQILKRKMTEVHRERRRIGFTPRMSVHDEITGDCADQESARMLAEILNAQSFPQLKVPIRWDVGIGPNWAEAKSK